MVSISIDINEYRLNGNVQLKAVADEEFGPEGEGVSKILLCTTATEKDKETTLVACGKFINVSMDLVC